MLARLVYVSRVEIVPEADLKHLILRARQHNADCGVTGVLLQENGIFLQALEGSREALSQIYAAILADKRHRDVQLLCFHEITQRGFGSWALGQVELSRVNTGTLLRYGVGNHLDPYAVSAESSVALLTELVATAAISGHA